MRACIDYRPALREGTGVGTYVRGLLTALARTAPDDRFVAFTASWRDRPGPELREAENVGLSDWRIPVRLLDWLWHRRRWPPVELLVGPVEIAHSPHPLLLPCRDGRRIVTVHDCYFLRHPDRVSGPMRRDYVPLARRAAGDADAVIVPSATTADEVEELMGVPRERIRVTHLGIDEIYHHPPAPDDPATRRILDDLGLTTPFLLFVGRREPRKDLGTLLQAFAEVARHSTEAMLVLVGPGGTGWTSTWEGAPETARSHTRILPHQPPEVLVHLYAAATALVIPSRWEGFGLPPVEAMSCGTPVVATRAGAMPEILGDVPLWVEPGDADALAERCRRLLRDPDLATARGARGRDRASSYRWEETAERTLELYRELAGP